MGIVTSPNTYAGFPVGLEVSNCDVLLEIHATVAIGSVVALDPTSATAGSDWRFTKTAAPASGNQQIDDNEFGVFAVALEAKTYDASTTTYAKFRVQGVVQALADGTDADNGDIAIGDALEVAGDSLALHLGTTIGAKVLGWALEARADDSEGLIQVMFDGLNGFGTVNA